MPPEEHASDSWKQNDQKRAYKRDEFEQKKKLSVTVILGDFLVKKVGNYMMKATK